MGPWRPGIPKAWTNQTLALYHGTLTIHVASVLATVDLSRCRTNTDFGQGFYTTTKEQQARDWAWQLANRRPGMAPAVIRFEVDRGDLSSLESLWFVRGSSDADDYWSLVFHCRSGGGHKGAGWYDIMIGPVAASRRARYAIPDSDQVSFHTTSASSVLDRSAKSVLP